MSYELRLEKISTPGKSGIVYLNDFVPHEASLLNQRGRFINLISIKHAKELDLDSMVLARQILGRLHSIYFTNTEKKVLGHLKQTLQKIESEFKSNDLTIGISSLIYNPSNPETIYVAVLGENGVRLIRDNNFATILAGTSDSEVIAASGSPKEGDVLVLDNNKLTDDVSPLKLTEIKQTNQGFEEFTSTVSGIVEQQKDKIDQCGTVFVYFEKNEVNQVLSAAEDLTERKYKNTMLENESPPEVLSNSHNYIPKKNNILETVSRLFARRQKIKPDLVSLDSKKSKRNTIIIGIVLLVTVGVAAVLGAQKKQRNDYRDSYISRVNSARENLDEARDLKDLNDERSREAYLSAYSEIEDLLNEGFNEPEVIKLKEEIDLARGEILKEVLVQKQTFSDLTLLADDFEALDAYVYLNDVYVIDKGGRIAKINAITKSAEIVAGPTLVGTQTDTISVYDSLVFLLKNHRDIEIIFGDGIESPETDYITGRVLMDAFAGNIYILERAQNKIFRHQRLTQGYGNGEEWLAEGIEPDFSDATDIVIDGMIWVGYEDGTISKFSNGLTQPFSIEGVSPAIKSIEYIYTNEDAENVYVLDKPNSRIVVLTKEGEFVLQYSLESAETISGIAAFEEEKLLLVVDRDKIYSIEI